MATVYADQQDVQEDGAITLQYNLQETHSIVGMTEAMNFRKSTR